MLDNSKISPPTRKKIAVRPTGTEMSERFINTHAWGGSDDQIMLIMPMRRLHCAIIAGRWIDFIKFIASGGPPSPCLLNMLNQRRAQSMRVQWQKLLQRGQASDAVTSAAAQSSSPGHWRMNNVQQSHIIYSINNFMTWVTESVLREFFSMFFYKKWIIEYWCPICRIINKCWVFF